MNTLTRRRSVMLFVPAVFLLVGLITVHECDAFAQLLTQQNGTIQSENYPNKYPPHSKQYWEILVPSDKQIVLTFTRLDLEAHQQCAFDYVNITSRGSSSINWTRHGVFCGSQLPPVIRTQGNSMQIQFASDHSGEYLGFQAKYTTVCASNGTCPNGKCISQSHFCDGDNDCGDYSDEQNCPSKTDKCTADGKIMCPDGVKCIPRHYRCDLDNDCTDNSDEMNCPGCDTSTVNITNTQYSTRTSTRVVHGQKLTVSCDPGYRLNKLLSTMTCKNGTWKDMPTFECNPACPLPTIPNTVSLPRKDYYSLGDSVVVICITGYFVAGNYPATHVNLTCTGPSTWSDNTTRLRCLPASDFNYFYQPEREELAYAASGHSVSFPCQVKSNQTTAGLSWLWLQNQDELSNIPGLNYSIADDGTLALFAVSGKSEGKYICFARNGFLYFPGDTVYTLKLNSSCLANPGGSSSIVVTVNEDASALIFCPYYDPVSLHSPIWYTGGKRIWKSDRIDIVANGGLFISRVVPGDEGVYTCETAIDTPFCERNFTTHLKVNEALTTRFPEGFLAELLDDLEPGFLERET